MIRTLKLSTVLLIKRYIDDITFILENKQLSNEEIRKILLRNLILSQHQQQCQHKMEIKTMSTYNTPISGHGACTYQIFLQEYKPKKLLQIQIS